MKTEEPSTRNSKLKEGKKYRKCEKSESRVNKMLKKMHVYQQNLEGAGIPEL